MAFVDIKPLLSMSESDIQQEIISIKRELLELRIRKSTRQEIKPHLFKHKKHRLAQLLTISKTK